MLCLPLTLLPPESIASWRNDLISISLDLRLLSFLVYCVLDYRHPLVSSFNVNIGCFCRCLAFQSFMTSYIVVIELITLEDWRIHCFDAPHYLLSIPYFTIESFHFVVIVIAC